MVQQLVDAGADIHAQGDPFELKKKKDYETPYDIAIAKAFRNPEILAILNRKANSGKKKETCPTQSVLEQK